MVMPWYGYSIVFVTTLAWAVAARSAVARAAIHRAVAGMFMAPPGGGENADSASSGRTRRGGLVQPVGVRKLGEHPPEAPRPARAQHREIGVALADAVLHAHAQAVARVPEEVDRQSHRDVGLHGRVERDQH